MSFALLDGPLGPCTNASLCMNAPAHSAVADARTELDVPFWAWLVFAGVIVVSVAVDWWGHRGKHVFGRNEPILWSIGWTTLALVFAVWVSRRFGLDPAAEFMNAYVIERTLSIENLFVIFAVFKHLEIPERDQHRVLFLGILGTLVTRAVLIASGTAVLARWHGIVYPLGVVLLFTAARTAMGHGMLRAERGVVAFLRRHLSITRRLHGPRFLLVKNGRCIWTPLALALVLIELADVFFAVDSIPSALAVSGEPFILYSSNVFALLGLHSLYLVVARSLGELRHVRYGLAVLLEFAGLKLLLSGVLHIRPMISLLVVSSIVAGSVIPALFTGWKRAREARRSRAS